VVSDPGEPTDGCDWRVRLGAWITSSGDHTDGCDVMGEIVGFSTTHRKMMVGEHNIKVGAVLTHQASLFG
jgi:hypothetical protein